MGEDGGACVVLEERMINGAMAIVVADGEQVRAGVRTDERAPWRPCSSGSDGADGGRALP